MAITMNRLTNGNGSGTSFNTAAFTPGTNTLVTAFLSENGSFTPGVTLPNGAGLTWVKIFDIETQTYGSSSSAGLWRAMASSPSNASLNITSSASLTGLQWDIIEFAGVDTSGTNGSGAVVQSSTFFASDTPLNGNLGSPSSASNAIAGFGASNLSLTFTHGSGYTTIDTGTFASIETFMSQWLNGVAQTLVDFTTTGGANIRAFGIEIKSGVPAPTDTFVEAWGMQSPQRHIGPARMVASGTVSTTRLP